MAEKKKKPWHRRTVVFVVLVAAGFGGFNYWLRTSLPTINGRIAVAGLGAEVTIVRDENAVPHIFATSWNDALYALGYAHAQDRLWQMEFQRRLGAGRLAEVLGKRALRFDKLMRTLGLYRRTEESFKYLSAPTRAAVEAYVRGVNAYLKTRTGALPPEFLLLGIEPEPWTPADSLVWSRLMALQLATNWRGELLRARLVKRLGAERTAVLLPPYPKDAPVTLAANEALDGARLERLWAALPMEMISTGASNEWVLSGARTESGKPILANDPHLGLSIPSIWYLARLVTPEGTLAGATPAGVPVVLLGHNGRIAWGFTTTYADTDDLFIERIDPTDKTRYLSPNGPRAFVTREEIIKVSGGDPVRLVVRETRHGPVLDGVLGDSTKGVVGAGHVLALSAPWLGRRDRTVEAIHRLSRAGDWNEFIRALEVYDAPTQNIVYADVDGHVGLYTPSRIPVRRKGDGLLPVPGWTGAYDWTGFIPFAELPHRLDPKGGVLVNANNRIAGEGYKPFISREWGAPYRAERIAKLLAARPRHSLESMAALQADVISPVARRLLPLMLKAAPKDGRGAKAAKMLEGWDGAMTRDRPEPLIFSAWLRQLNRALYADELGDLFGSYWGPRPAVVEAMLTREKHWCDDIKTADKRETCASRLALALDRALTRLARRYGGDMKKWRWGAAHYLDLRHRILDAVPLVGGLANVRRPAPGGNFTINRAGSVMRDGAAPFALRHGPGYRAIYDLSNLDNSLFMHAGGQSGNPFSPHYSDLIGRWLAVEYVRLKGSRAELARRAIGTLRLIPAAGSR